MAYFQINLSNFFLKTVRFRTVNSALAVHDIFKPGRYEDFGGMLQQPLRVGD